MLGSKVELDQPMENICGKVKLELQVAILTIRLKCIILEDIDFDFHEIRLWTDSQITLSHISNLFKRFQTFILCMLYLKQN